MQWMYRKSRDRPWPEVMSVTWPEVTWPEEAFPGTRSDRVCMLNRYILYYYYSSSTKCSTVVHVPWLLEVTFSHVTPKGVPLGARMHTRKLCNIRPSGAFWLEVTSPEVLLTGSDVITRRASLDFSYISPWGALYDVWDTKGGHVIFGHFR